MTFFVDTSMEFPRIVIVPHHEHPHSHEMHPLIKASFAAKELYRKLFAASGSAQTTVQRLENGKVPSSLLVCHYLYTILAPTTAMILGGASIADLHPSMNNKALKNREVKKARKELFPLGMGIEGTFSSFFIHTLSKCGSRVETVQS